MTWWQGRLLALDTETTGPLPEVARVVQYGVAWVGGGESPARHSAVVNPGVPIPPEATAVHGITDAQAAGGVPERDAVEFMVEQLSSAAARHLPVVVVNARFDLTIVDRLSRLYAIDLGDLWERLRVVDPMVLDRWLDRYRRSYPYGHTAETAKAAGVPSSRTLEGMAAHYGAELDQAHDAASDAITGARIAYVLGKRGQVIRRRNDREAQESRAMWAQARGDLDELHATQVAVALAERARFAAYRWDQVQQLIDALAPDDEIAAARADAERIDAERGWPVLEVMPHEQVAA
jgi:DNA polymerase-3 subunit epsilon